MKFYIEVSLVISAIAVVVTYSLRPLENFFFRFRIPPDAIASLAQDPTTNTCPQGFEHEPGNGYIMLICLQRYRFTMSQVVSHVELMNSGVECSTGFRQVGTFYPPFDKPQALCAKLEHVKDATQILTGLYEVKKEDCDPGDTLAGIEDARSLCAKYDVMPYSISQMSIFGEPKNPLSADVQTIFEHIEKMNQIAPALAPTTLSEVAAKDIEQINRALIHYEEIAKASHHTPDRPFVVVDGKVRAFDGAETKEIDIAPETLEVLERSDLVAYMTAASMEWVWKESSLPPPPMAYLRGARIHRSVSSVDSP